MAFLQEYTMLDELGYGGFATVYKVRHNELGYIRAIRVLNETIVAKSGEDPKKNETYQKFLRECKVLLRLGNGCHPNIVHIFKPDLLENKAIVEMDYVDGGDIFDYLEKNHNFVPVEEIIRMAKQISSALAYCHEDIYRFCMDKDFDNLKDDPKDGKKVLLDDQTRKRLIEKYKVIHNDIHSGNIMHREDGNFVLLDFGLAINGNEVVRSSRRKNGAPEFKAPEKWDNEAILTEQSDIYSFGVLLYQCLAGRVPFPFDTRNSNETEAEYLLSKAHQYATPPSIEGIRKEFFERKFKGEEYKKDYPQWLEDVILKCLSKNPKDRFRNGKELYEYISAYAKKTYNAKYELEIERLTSDKDSLITQVSCLRDTQNQLELLRLQLKKSRTLLWILLIFFGLLGLGTSFYAWNNRPTEWKKQIEEKNQIISSANDEIDSLKTEISELQKNEGQKVSTTDNSSEVTRLTNLNVQKDQRIRDLEDQLSKTTDNSAEITNFKKKVAENSAELKRLNDIIKQKDQKIQNLESTIKEKDREISALKKY